jgi:Zn-dependent peptidase ImmA (M78 family)/transcriptional regulator with XRE-family HTH domain
MIHDRIRRARLLRGLSLEALAQRVGDITKQGVSKFEKAGAVPPSSARLLQLAKALEVKPEYFFRPDTVQLGPLEFRKLASMPQKHQQQVGEQIRDHLERYISLERCFEVDGAVQAVEPPRTLPVQSFDDAEVAAESLRKKWNVGGDAIAHLTELLEEHGIKVALLDDQEGFDGACAASEDNSHVLIALNRDRPGERLRFTAAHELGHWVMALPEDMPEKDKETCCHRFAGAFLYPRARVLAEFGSHKRSRVLAIELLNAKRRHGVSMAVALRRLKDLHLVTDAGYQGMNMQFSANGWRRAEPEPLLPEQPKRFESMVYRALAEDLISLSRAAELLQCAVSELDPSLTHQTH